VVQLQVRHRSNSYRLGEEGSASYLQVLCRVKNP